MRKKELPVFAVILYFAAVLTAAGATFMACDFLPELFDAISSGYLTISDNMAYIVSLCMAQFIVYYIYALLLTAAGSAIQHSATAARAASEAVALAEKLEEKTDEEFEKCQLPVNEPVNDSLFEGTNQEVSE